MGRAKMIHEAAIERKGTVHNWPGLEIITEHKQPWYIRAAIWTGVIMATPESPRGWSLNPATVTLMILIASLIAGGSYYIGARDAEMRVLQEKIQKAADDAAKAKQLETYNAGSVDAMKGHANSNTEKRK